MNKNKLLNKVCKNIGMNLFLAVIFIILNNWAYQNSFEETFVSLAFIYGMVVVVLNALFVARF